MALLVNDIKDEITQFIIKHLDVANESFTHESNLFEDGHVDSIRLEKLFGFIEDTYNLVLDEEHFFDERITSINGLYEIITEIKDLDRKEAE